jgi:CheY-like chemotaxis protein/anti-sigma regulatory factor (Ser/Thr protein kinase)
VGQVLINLLGNSVKFTARGEVRVDVRHTDGDGGPWLELRVTDTGRGIQPARLGSVFEPYDQGDPDLERRFSGSGLGLAICRRIVEAMHGEIRVESEVDRGSVFTVRLPAPVTAPVPGEAPVERALRGVVLISAEASTRRAVSAAGAYHGVRVTTAPSVEEGIALWRSEGGRDPVVLDATGDPASAAALLAEAVGDAAPRILAVRPLELSAVRSTGAGRSFDALTGKPVTLRRIARAVSELGQPRSPVADPVVQRPLRVLVVDDDLISRQIAQSLIRRLGHEVGVAPDGTSALAASGAQGYDVYVIDLHMPDMMGTDLARALQERYGQRPYLLALTAAALTVDRQRCLDAGMHGFLTKPVDVDALREAFERIAQRFHEGVVAPKPDAQG